MRLIDADKTIEELSVAYFDKKIQSAKNDPCVIDAMADWAIRTIKAMPTIGGWISCSERLPELNVDVLVCDRNGSISIDSAIKYGGEVLFGYDTIYGNSDIIAWQPLPLPYGGE